MMFQHMRSDRIPLMHFKGQRRKTSSHEAETNSIPRFSIVGKLLERRSHAQQMASVKMVENRQVEKCLAREIHEGFSQFLSLFHFGSKHPSFCCDNQLIDAEVQGKEGVQWLKPIFWPVSSSRT